MRVLFKNGTVVSGKGTRRADVLVDGEKIRRVAREIHVTTRRSWTPPVCC